MANSTNKALVMRISATSETYYLSGRHGGVTLDSEDYENLLLSVGDASKRGNFGEGKERGFVSVSILNGEQWHQGNYIFDVTNVFNNRSCAIKLADPSSDTSWETCEDYYKGIIKNLKIGNDIITFDVDDTDYRDDTTFPITTVEDIITGIDNVDADDIPTKFRGRRVPVQIGDLSDAKNGEFGKTITTVKKVGYQEIIADVEPLNYMEGVGAWEPGTSRFFLGKKKTTTPQGKIVGEYNVSNNNNSILFNIDSNILLKSEIITTAEGIESIEIGLVNSSDWTKLNWTDEDNTDNDVPELLGTNIISIDNEFMQIVKKPRSNTIWVERGFNGSTITTHLPGAKIIQSAQYSSKNLLSFTEKFEPIQIANQHYDFFNGGPGRSIRADQDTLNPSSYISQGIWKNMLDGDTETFIEFSGTGVQVSSINESRRWVNFDIKFTNITRDFITSKLFAAVKVGFEVSNPSLSGYVGYNSFNIINPSTESNPDINLGTPLGRGQSETMTEWKDGSSPRRDQSAKIINSVETLVSEQTYDNYTELSRLDYNESNVWNPNIWDSNGIVKTSLKSLNKKWKCNWQFFLGSFRGEVGTGRTNLSLKIYNLGIWADFFIDFTDDTVTAPLIGREYTNEMSQILTGGNSITGTVIDNPLGGLLTIMLDCGYLYTDFNTSNWQTVYSYVSNSDNYPLSPEIPPEVAYSYGVDESSGCWDLVQAFASYHNFSLVKGDDGKVKVINLHQLQSTDVTSGYVSLTAYAIPIETILKPSERRLLDIQQTGTDRLRNSVIVNYRRNNSTDEYQSSYPTQDDSPDDYVLPESGITLLQARNTYFGSEKTETLTIDCPTIYNKEDARRLWEWNINDKAEVFFWATFTVDYEHYTLINSKSTQYEIGDIIYLDGVYSGVTFNSSHKWVIRNIKKKDSGREFEIEAKSIEPISEFTSSAVGQNITIQNVTENSPRITLQNTVDTLEDAYQNKL